ncbi:ParA family protein [Deinococcus aquatilis]|jgi:chromosome partitioning protein|uniref:ParA family protein n=1 Tax=Deinococcus aquatilis TaxID=519440 RepID=UPI00035D85E2|nr:ParA family protein [Deinococcus aquatilis]
MKVLTFFNHVGGAMKSSLTREVAFAMGALGQRVLMIDLDPQANLSSWAGVYTEDLSQTVHDTAVDDAPLPSPVRTHGVDLIPSNVLLSLVEGRMLGTIGAQMNLRAHLQEEMTDRYDVVLIDSPPSLGQLAVLGAIAADHLIVPVPTEEKGVLGLKGLTQMLPAYRKLNPSLSVALYVPTRFDTRNSHDREMLAFYQENLRPLASPVPLRAVWKDAQLARQPLSLYDPRSEANGHVIRVTNEIITAVGLPVEVRRGES